MFTFIAAPMDGVIDSPFRKLIREFSKEALLFTEMRHIASITTEPQKALQHNLIEHPLACQISANSTRFLEEALEKITTYNFSELNLNAGCPAKNVIKSGSGSTLMAKPELLRELLLTCKQKLPKHIPLTLKIRAGYKEKNGLRIAQLAEDSGVETLYIHPRTQIGGFSAPLDFKLVKQIKEKLNIPIVFSGDIRTYQDAQETHEKTGVDHFMIGRALWGAPWKLKELSLAMKGKKFHITTQEIINIAIKHLKLNIDFYGLGRLQPFKSHLAQYVKGLPNATTLRRTLLTIDDHRVMEKELYNLGSVDFSSCFPELRA